MALPQPERMSGVAPPHVRHKPEQTLLYQLVEQYWPEFHHAAERDGSFSVTAIAREFKDYQACWST